MRISDICTRNVVHISAAASVREAATTMRSRHVGALVVVDQPNGERIPIGILTDRDIVLSVVAAGVDAERLSVGDAMSQPVATCSEHDDVFGAIETMRRYGVRRLPLLNAAGGLSGMLAADDIVGALGDYLHGLGHALSREQAHEMEARK